LAIVTISGGIGYRLLGEVPAGRAAGLVVQAAFGLGLLSLVIFGFLWVGLFTRAIAWVVAAALALALRRSSLRWLTRWASCREFAPRSAWERVAAGAILLFLALALIEAAAPPVHYDALVYHLDLPRRFLLSGSLFGPVDNLYWGMPLAGEMLYTLAEALGRAQTAALVGFAAAGLTCAGVFAVASEFGRPAGWVALLALLAGPSVAAAAGWGYVDWWAALYGFALIAVVLRLDQTSSSRWAALAGVMAGFAAGTKYSATVAIPAGFVAILSVLPSRRGLRLGVAFLGAAAVVLAPWLLKNVAATGAPLYPYLGSAAGISAARQSAVIGSAMPPPLAQSLLAPLAATISGHEQAPGFASDIGPLLVALLPGLVFLSGSERRRLLPLGAFLVTGWGMWTAASRFSGLLIQTRLYYVLLPALAVVAGCGFLGYPRLSLGRARVGRVVALLIALVVGLSLLAAVRASAEADALRVVLGSEPAAEYLTRRLGAYYPAQESLGRLPAGSRTLMLWEPRGLYCLNACAPDAWIDEWYVARRSLEDPQAIRADWIGRGFTHLLIYDAGRDFVQDSDRRYRPEDWETLESLLAELPLIERIGDAYSLYRLD
jgi:hypothetical protein